MGHSIQAIVAPESTAKRLLSAWPELEVLHHKSGFCIFPVSDELIDSKIQPTTPSEESEDECILLTSSFEYFLRDMSRGGILAYIETDYFGGIGGQRAIVFRDCITLMQRTWAKSGTINTALKLIGVPGGFFRDRFSVIGFNTVRDNDDLIDQIAQQNR